MSDTIQDKITESLYDLSENVELLNDASKELAQRLEIEFSKNKMSSVLIKYMERVLELTDSGYSE